MYQNNSALFRHLILETFITINFDQIFLLTFHNFAFCNLTRSLTLIQSQLHTDRSS